MKIRKLLIFIVFLLLALFFEGYANPQPAAEDEGIVLTWQDVQQLFDLKGDKIKLTWKEFQKLLQQMGNQMDMKPRT
jgi:hypothetical protein